MRRQHSSISLENFVGGEGFDEVVVQVAAVRALLDVAVLGEILHADSHVHHRLAAVFAVEASLKKKTRRKSESSGWISLANFLQNTLVPSADNCTAATCWNPSLCVRLESFLSHVMSGPLTLGGPPYYSHPFISRASGAACYDY